MKHFVSSRMLIKRVWQVYMQARYGAHVLRESYQLLFSQIANVDSVAIAKSCLKTSKYHAKKLISFYLHIHM